MSDSEWAGKPHTLIVHLVRVPGGPLDDGELDYDLEHPPSCKQKEHTYPGVLEWTCDVGEYVRESGMPFLLRYSGTPITEPGTYRIQAWGRKTYYWDSGYEYDAGVSVMQPEETTHA